VAVFLARVLRVRHGRWGSAIRILVLDDEPFMHRVLVHMLAGLGFPEVSTREDGASTLAEFAAGLAHPELIFLDLNMPRMDGIEFLRGLAGQGYGGSVVLLSAEGERVLQMTEKLVQAHRMTVLGHLRKPVSLSALSAILQKWLPPGNEEPKAERFSPQALRAALENGELENYYQPKVAIASASLVGFEALVRWRHAEEGLVTPDRFISVAEEYGLIAELTRGVLARAFEQSAAWRRAGLALGMAVNVSMENLADPGFADEVLTLAASLGATPRDITLELTESRLLLDQRLSLEALARLRIRHFRLAIDDFGTGHSSLLQLRDIAFDELKIDQAFVHGAWHDATSRAICEASLALGRQLGMEVVAEGARDRDDWNFLVRSGCDLAQGHFIGAAMPAARLPDWIAAWEQRAPLLRAGL
jgi:EAL domain-containing protein (putative c-di-GMP-specific phosphodiesterase class I)/CheY-like chemotaxis protein